MSTRLRRGANNTTTNAENANAASTEANEAAGASQMQSAIKRRFNVSIYGSLNSLNSEGPNACTWRPSEKTLVSSWAGQNASDEIQDHAKILKSLSNVQILSCKCIEYDNKFPVPVGVHISCVNGSEIAENGEKVALAALADSHNTQPIVIHESESNADVSHDWLKMFGEYTRDNIATKNVLTVDKQDYVFVNQCHPVISVLKANPEILGAPLEDHQKIDGQWYKVSTDAHNKCCETITKRILSQVNAADLRNLSVRISRNDLASEWTEVTGPLAHAHSTNNDIVNKPCYFHARLELEYNIL
jgi:hypothetical protein